MELFGKKTKKKKHFLKNCCLYDLENLIEKYITMKTGEKVDVNKIYLIYDCQKKLLLL